MAEASAEDIRRYREKMKIWYAVNARLPTEKAHGYQIMKMCEAFADAGADVTLLVPSHNNSLKGDPFVFYSVRNNFTIISISVIKSPWLIDSFFILLYPLLIFTFMIRLSSFFKKHSHAGDLVYTRDAELAWHLSRRHRVVYEAHVWNRSSRLVCRARHRLLGCVTITRHLASLFMGAGFPAEKILVAPSAVDLADFQENFSKKEARTALSLPFEKKLIGYVGRFYALGGSKGIETIIDALALIHDEGVIAVLVGGLPGEISLYRKKAEALHIAHRVIFVPFQRHASVPIYMRAMDVLVMPSPRTDFYTYYTSPLKLFEYMASGVPIVASDLPALREILTHEETALLAEPDNAASFAAQCSRIFCGAALAARLAGAARHAVLGHTWSARARAILSFICI